MIGHRIPERETFRILIFYAEEKVLHATVIPRLRHTGFYFPPSDKSDGPVTADWSNDKGLSLLSVGPSNKEIFDFHIWDRQCAYLSLSCIDFVAG